MEILDKVIILHFLLRTKLAYYKWTIIIKELNECDLFIWKCFITFFIYVDWWSNNSFKKMLDLQAKKYFIFQNILFQIHSLNKQLFL